MSALRVSRAVTRLTVYRAPKVLRSDFSKHLCKNGFEERVHRDTLRCAFMRTSRRAYAGRLHRAPSRRTFAESLCELNRVEASDFGEHFCEARSRRDFLVRPLSVSWRTVFYRAASRLHAAPFRMTFLQHFCGTPSQRGP